MNKQNTFVASQDKHRSLYKYELFDESPRSQHNFSYVE